MAYLPVLLRIQEIENRLRQLQRDEEQQRANSELINVKKHMAEAAVTTKQLQAQREQNLQRQRRVELEIKDNEEHIKAIETKLYSGSGMNSRELEQLQQKEAEYRKSKEECENSLLTLMDEDEQAGTQLDALTNEMQAYQCHKDEIEGEIKAAIGVIMIEKLELEAELPELTPQVPAEWLERYRRIASSHHGVAIAKMKMNACGACHVSLSDALLQKVKRGDDTLNFCESCGRILFY